MPISVDSCAKYLKVYNCVFRNCKSVIQIRNCYDEKLVKLHCKQNVFENVSFAPFWEMHYGQGSGYNRFTHLYSLENNVMLGGLAKGNKLIINTRRDKIFECNANKIFDMQHVHWCIWRKVNAVWPNYQVTFSHPTIKRLVTLSPFHCTKLGLYYIYLFDLVCAHIYIHCYNLYLVDITL